MKKAPATQEVVFLAASNLCLVVSLLLLGAADDEVAFSRLQFIFFFASLMHHQVAWFLVTLVRYVECTIYIVLYDTWLTLSS